MATRTLTAENFDEVVEGNDLVIVDFWADWCGPCKAFGPVFEAMSEKYPDIVFGKVDSEAEQELSSHFQVRSIPFLMIFREQIVIYMEAGAMPAQQFEQLIEGARSLDMEQIRQRLADENEQ